METRLISSLAASYAVALIVLAVLSIGAYVVISQVADTEARTAARINESGQQAISVMQVAMLTERLIRSDSPGERTDLRAQLAVEIDEIEARHATLLGGNPARGIPPLQNPTMRALFYEPPYLLDQQIAAFVREGRALVASPDRELTPVNRHYQYVYAEASGRLYESLNATAAEFERQAEIDVVNNKKKQAGVMFAMLAVLAVEALLIFQPMVKRVAADRRQLAGEVAERERAVASERAQRTIAEALRDTASALIEAVELDDVLTQILENVAKVVPHDAANIMLIDGDEAHVVRVHGYSEQGLEDAVASVSFRISETENLRQMLETRRPHVIPDVNAYAGWADVPGTKWIRSHIGVPILTGETAFGFISLDSSQPDAFGNVQTEWLRAFADQAAVAIQNARLFDAMRRSAAELAHRAAEQAQVARLGQRALAGASLGDLLNEVCETIPSVLGVEFCNVMEYQADRQQFVLRAGYGPLAHMIGTLTADMHGHSGYTLQCGEPVIVEDMRAETRFVASKHYREYGITSGFSVIIPGRNEPFGVLGIHTTARRRFTAEHVTFAQSVANVLAAAIDRKAAEKQVEDAFHRTQELYEISRLIGLVRTPEDILRSLLIARPLISASRASFLVFDHPWGEQPPQYVELLAAWQPGPEPIPDVGTRHSFRDLELATLLRRDGPVVIPDVRTQPELAPGLRAIMEPFGTRSLTLFPMVAGGNWYGMLSIHSREPSQLSEQDARHLHGLVDQAAVALYSLLLLKAEADARRRAEKADELKLKFLAMISHELRTPLTSIKGFATTLLQPDVTFEAADQQEFVEIISQEADKLADLIEQLLDLSRLEAGTLSIEPEEIELSTLVSNCIPQLQMVSAGHILEVYVPPDVPSLRADPGRITQVISNLVANAAKYSPEGTVIQVAATLEAEFVRLDVSDQGQGIPPEERELVFQAFRQASNRSQRDTKGAGLGLAIARALIEAHGGRIWVQNRAGPGTTISFTLPFASHFAAPDWTPVGGAAEVG